MDGRGRNGNAGAVGVGADEWGKQMESMLADMTAALKDLGYIN